MKFQRLILLLIIALSATPAVAQHSDIDFSYEDGAIVMRDGVEGFTDGFQVFEGTFPERGFSERFTENPGFLSELANGDMLAAFDDIQIELLQSNTFGTYLTYYDPIADAMMPTDATLNIEDNMGDNTTDILLSNLETTGDNPQFIQTASSSAEVHSHIDFFLSEEAEPGAYGFLFRLITDNPAIENSQPVWLVFNFGMSPVEFDEMAIPAFVGEDFILGDTNGDGLVNLLDVGPFVDAITTGTFSLEADINGDGLVNLLDVGPFVDLLTG